MRFCADASGGVSRARVQALARREGVALSGYATALCQARGLAAGASPPRGIAATPPLSPMLATPHEDARHSGAAPVRHRDAQQRAGSPHAGSPYERPAAAASPRGGDGGKREVIVSVDATRNTTTAQGGTYAILGALKAAGFRYEKTPAPHWALGYAADDTVMRVLHQAADAERVPLRVVALSGGGGGGGDSGASGQQHAW
jgi:hypothetical protein